MVIAMRYRSLRTKWHIMYYLLCGDAPLHDPGDVGDGEEAVLLAQLARVAAQPQKVLVRRVLGVAPPHHVLIKSKFVWSSSFNTADLLKLSSI